MQEGPRHEAGPFLHVFAGERVMGEWAHGDQHAADSLCRAVLAPRSPCAET